MALTRIKKWLRDWRAAERFDPTWRSRFRSTWRRPRHQLFVEALEARTVPSASLNVDIIVAPNFIVDSNMKSGPTAAMLEAKVTNTGTDTLHDVFVYSGDGTTPGTFPSTTWPGLSGNFSLTQVGGAPDATRYVGTLEPGQ